MTGSYVVPGIMFLQAVGLPRDQLIQAMGMLFLVSTLALALALSGNDFLSLELGLLSIAGLVPTIAVLLLGQRLRRRATWQRFLQVFFFALSRPGPHTLVLRPAWRRHS